nr:tripartite tricarboxylate transporter TctB family protein [uncultured Devosia sp.]
MPTAKRDLAAGVLYLVVGTAFVAASLGLPIGTIQQMGPGYFPLILGSLLCLTGVAVAIRATRSRETQPIGAFNLRVVCAVLGSVALFALAVIPLGFVLALMILTIVSSFARTDVDVRTTLLSTIGIVVLSVVVFVVALRIQVPLWPFFVTR